MRRPIPPDSGVRAVRHDSELVAQAWCGGLYLAGRVPHRTRTSDSHEAPTPCVVDVNGVGRRGGRGRELCCALSHVGCSRASPGGRGTPRRWARPHAVLRRCGRGRPRRVGRRRHEGNGRRLGPPDGARRARRTQVPLAVDVSPCVGPTALGRAISAPRGLRDVADDEDGSGNAGPGAQPRRGGRFGRRDRTGAAGGWPRLRRVFAGLAARAGRQEHGDGHSDNDDPGHHSSPLPRTDRHRARRHSSRATGHRWLRHPAGARDRGDRI
jgi:hypothetical protein